jgi:hypothetical protein
MKRLAAQNLAACCTHSVIHMMLIRLAQVCTSETKATACDYSLGSWGLAAACTAVYRPAFCCISATHFVLPLTSLMRLSARSVRSSPKPT